MTPGNGMSFQTQLEESIKRVLNEIDLETLYKIKQMDDKPMTIIEDQLLQDFGQLIETTEEQQIDTKQESQKLADDQQFNLNL